MCVYLAMKIIIIEVINYSKASWIKTHVNLEPGVNVVNKI